MPRTSALHSAALLLTLAATRPVSAAEQTPPAPPESNISRLANEAGAQSQVDAALDAVDEDAPGPASGAAPSPGAPPHVFAEADVAESFTSGARAEAKRLFDRGQPLRALRLLEGEGDAPPVRYLRAMSALRAGRAEVAAGELSALAEAHPALRDHCLFHAGAALERLGRRRDAEQRYAEVARGSTLFPRARLALARIRQRRRELAGAVEALTPLVQPGALDRSSTEPAEAWMAIARLARIQADYDGEHRALLAVWATQPFSAEARRAWERLRLLPLPAKWKVTRAETFISLHHNREAISQLEQLLRTVQLPDEVACRAHFALGLALRKERRHPAAIRALTPVVEQCRGAEVRPRAMYVLGYSQSVVDPASAITTYQSLAYEHPEHPYADDALLFAGETALHAGDEEAALGHWTALLERFPAQESTADALFRRFWVLRGRGAAAEGLEALGRIESLHGVGASAAQVRRARYWRARALEELGKREEALSLFEAVAADAGFYGLLARSQLKASAPERVARVLARLATPSEAAPGWPLDAGRMADEPHFRTGLELLRMGFRREALQELGAIDTRAQGEGALLLLYRLFERTGSERQARSVARALVRVSLRGPTEAEARRLYALSYPQPFRPLVERHSRAAGVDPDLMQALMREESAFNPRARSATGALGLAQLMPRTAQEVARALGAPDLTEQSLLEPRHNIRLGAAYLGTLRKQFDGNLAFAVASYNAGPGAVLRWRRRLAGLALDEWVEEIPVEETRNYVKRVLGSFATYQLLSARGGVTALEPVRRAQRAQRPEGRGQGTALLRTQGLRSAE